MATLWKLVYSFFGFASYTKHTDRHTAHRVFYWCLFPLPGLFFRKIDLFKVNVSSTESIEVQRALTRANYLRRGEKVPEWLESSRPAMIRGKTPVKAFTPAKAWKGVL